MGKNLSNFLAFVCLLTVGCGKPSEKKSDSVSKSESPAVDAPKKEIPEPQEPKKKPKGKTKITVGNPDVQKDPADVAFAAAAKDLIETSKIHDPLDHDAIRFSVNSGNHLAVFKKAKERKYSAETTAAFDQYEKAFAKTSAGAKDREAAAADRETRRLDFLRKERTIREDKFLKTLKTDRKIILAAIDAGADAVVALYESQLAIRKKYSDIIRNPKSTNTDRVEAAKNISGLLSDHSLDLLGEYKRAYDRMHGKQ